MKKELNIKSSGIGLFTDEIIEKILEVRGIKDVEHFMNPVEEDLIPFEKMDMIKEAADIFIEGIYKGKKFFVLYDTDSDGCTAGTIITRYLKGMGLNPDWYINDGKLHGCNESVIKEIKKSNPDIVIIVDSLDESTKFYEEIAKCGIKIIILDHHDISDNVDYDKYVTLVSSNRKSYPNHDLSGAGVVWKFIKYIDSILGTVEADNFVDLSACGILADVMMVDEEHKENRYIVSKGLENIKNPAINKIIGSYQFDSTSVLFSISPLINAANRYNKNKDAVLTLLSDDNKEITSHLRVLKKCKETQTNEVNCLLPDLIEQCENQRDKKLLFTVVETKNGIAGLLAMKLVEKFKKPAIVVKETKTGYVGSARGLDGHDLRILCEKTECGQFNGHPSAFGVIIQYNKYDEFREKIEDYLSNIEFSQTIDADMELNVEDVNQDLVTKIKNLCKISGNGFKPIAFAITVDNYDVEMVGEKKHMVVTPYNSNTFQFVKWNAGDDLCEEIEDHSICGDEITFVGTLDAGFLAKKFRLKMIVDDIIVKN